MTADERRTSDRRRRRRRVQALTRIASRARSTPRATSRLDVAPGEFLTLLGPSGCGKTTTLRMIAGFEKPDAGTHPVRRPGRHRALPANRRNIGFVFQNYALFPHLSVFENVAYGLRVRGIADGRRSRSASREVLALVGLAGYEQQFSQPALRRRAAARRARARHRHPAARAAVRRAAVEPRRQAARADAHRDPRPAAPARRSRRSTSRTTRRRRWRCPTGSR